jgi:hypothetical protein
MVIKSRCISHLIAIVSEAMDAFSAEKSELLDRETSNVERVGSSTKLTVFS